MLAYVDGINVFSPKILNKTRERERVSEHKREEITDRSRAA